MRLGDAAVLVDHVGDPLRVFVLLARRCAVREADAAIFIAQQRERKIELLRELCVVFRRVEADSEDGGVLRFVLRREVPEPGTFERSARGVGFRIKPEDDALAAQAGEADGVAVVVAHFEIGSLITCMQHWRTSGHGADGITNDSAQ
jgi:hypothetical protein